MFPEQLRGMFGIAVWDQKRQRGVIARDRLGIKPMYYAVCGDSLVFASELKSLLASGLVPTDLDYEAIDAYLSLGFFPAPATPLAAVKKLEPGCILVIENGAVEERRFWSYPEPTLERGGSVEEWSERLLAELEESVRMRLMSDVPLGAMLSGGLDSSLIVALMAKQMDRPVETFAVGFKEAGAGNELADARFVADDARRQPPRARALVRRGDDLARPTSSGTSTSRSPTSPRSASSRSPSWLRSTSPSRSPARAPTSCSAATGSIAPPRSPARGSASLHRCGARSRCGGARPRAAAPAGLHARRRRARPSGCSAMSGALTGDCGSELVRGPLAELDGNAALRAISYRLGDLPDAPLPATLFLDGQLGLADDMLHYFDRASMAHSLEVRVPFLDHHVVELCATMPANLKVRRLETKHVLKHAARGLVPDRIIDKPKIGFFNAAVDGWFRAQTRGAISDYLLGPNPRYAEMLDRTRGREARQGSGRRGEAGNGYVLLSVLMLEVWLSEYLPRAQAARRLRRSPRA